MVNFMPIGGLLFNRPKASSRRPHLPDCPNLLASSQGGYSLVSAHVLWAGADGKWSAALDASNLGDKLYYLSMFNQLSSFGTLTGQPAEPRNFMFSVKYSF
jgi:iron complex outermembrane recepter protein